MSHRPYQHSAGFARIKRITETIPNNLTSVEYLTTLDLLIANALFPILVSSRYIDTFLVKILAWQSANPKRKTASVSRAELPSYITLFLLTSDPEDKLALLQKIGFDRGILFEIIRRWVDIMKKYVDVSSDTSLDRVQILAHREKILKAASMWEDSYPVGSYSQVKAWYERAIQFKAHVLEKYTRLCLNTAQSDYVKLGCRVELDDILQVYLFTAAKAIDKCDATRGVLTTHIQNWLKNARNHVIRNYLNRVETSEKNEGNEEETQTASTANETEIVEATSPLDDLIDRQATILRVRQLARFFDPKGYARLALGIEEYPTEQMRAQIDFHNSSKRLAT